MATSFVSPTTIRRAAIPGETAIQNFTVNLVPNGTIVATLDGGSPFIRFQAITASEQVRVRLTDEEFALLPAALQNEAHRFSIESEVVGRAQSGESLPVKPGFHVEGAIEFVAPADAAPNSVTATLIVETSTGHRIDIPIVFVIGDLQVEFLDNPVVAFRGQEVQLTVRLTQSAGAPPTDLTLDSVEPFMRVFPQIVSVPGGGSATAVVSLFTDAVTPLGPRSTNLRVDGFSGLATNFPFDVTVKDAFGLSGAIVPSPLTAPQGGEVNCEVRFVVQGATGPIEIQAGKLPFGVRMEPSSFSIVPGGATEVRTVKFIVDRDAPTGSSLWVPIAWRSADGQNAGFFNTRLTITLTPESRTFRHQVVTPAGTALGGDAELTIRNDGSYTFRGHLHDSGFDSYDVRLSVVLRTAPEGFISLAEVVSGRVAGTVGSGSRDFDWGEQPLSHELLRRQWPSFRDGAVEFRFDFDDTGVLGLLGDVPKVMAEIIAASVIGGAEVAPLIMIGSRLARSADLPITSPPGILGAVMLGGAVLLFGPLAVFPAFVAGAAIASLADIKSRPMRDEERRLAFKVFKDTLPIDRIRVTNLINSDGTSFCTLHTPDQSIILGLGEDGFNFVNRNLSTDKTFIHELTHAWQFEHSSPSVVALWDQIRKPFLTEAQAKERYDINPIDGRPWSAYGIEQQAEVVAIWFVGNSADLDGADALRSSLFPYIQNHIRMGRA